MKNKKKLFIGVSLLLFSFLSHWIWISSFSILASTDWTYQGIPTLKDFFSVPYLWSNATLGSINIGISFTPFQFLYAILAHWNIDYGISERLIFFWPILLVFPLGSYLFIKKNINSTIGAVVGSFVYCYNTYFFELKTSQLTLLLSFGFSPLIFYFFQRTLEDKKIKYALLTGLFSFIASFYEFRAFYILCFILFFYYLYFVFFIEEIRNIKKIIQISFLAVLPLLITLLLNSYWILGLSKTGTLTSNIYFNRSLFGNEFLNINYALTLFHPFWTGGKTSLFIAENIPIYIWLIPFFAFLGLFLQRKNKQILFFGLMALLGIFLTKQVGHPFPSVYPWLYKYFPGFNAFREASKFYFIIALSYSILIAAFIGWLWSKWQIKKWQILGKYLITIVVSFLFIWNLKPIITGEFRTLFVARWMPKDFVITNGFILQQNQFFRSLWIPTGSRWVESTNLHPAVNAVDALDQNWYSFTKNKRTDKITKGELTIEELKFPGAQNLLNASSIKYVIVPLEDKQNEDDFFPYYGKKPSYYIQELDKIKFLHKINIGTKEIAIYENNNFRPHIYTTEENLPLKTDNLYKKVNFQAINLTQYSIQLEGITTPIYLNFAESYHPQWKLRVGTFNWWDTFLKKNYFLSDSNHSKNQANENSFYIDPKKICQEFSCVKNSDGSYSMKATLYFSPQSYTYLGLIISGIGGITFLGVLLFIGIKALYEKK